jgi:hypothetical protein
MFNVLKIQNLQIPAFILYDNNLIIPFLWLSNVCEVSPDWLRYELPKLGIAGSNPALRTFLRVKLRI